MWLCVCAHACVCVERNFPKAKSWVEGCPGPGHHEAGLPGDAGHPQGTRDHAVIVPGSPPDVHPHVGGHSGPPGKKTAGATSHWNPLEPWAWPWGCPQSPHEYECPPTTSPGAHKTRDSHFHPAHSLSAGEPGASFYFFPE